MQEFTYNVSVKWKYLVHATVYIELDKSLAVVSDFKVVIHVEMPKAAPKKSICHFQTLEMILKWNQQNTVRLPQKYQIVQTVG